MHVETSDPGGRTVKADGNCITYAALGDSVSMGCLGGNTQASGQRSSGPKQLANMLGLTMVLPELSGNGIPAAVQPASTDQRLVIHNPADFLVWHKGKRLNPSVVPNNLAITGADIRSIADDITMCDDTGALTKFLFWAGSGEDTRKAVVVTGGQKKAPPEWLASMATLPQIVTIEAGANDALGVVIGGHGGEIFENDAAVCKAAPFPNDARNLSTVPSFKNEYKLLISRILDKYNGADVKPVLVFMTVPDVSVIPAVAQIPLGKRAQPFASSDFRATAKLFFHNTPLDRYIKEATMDSTTYLTGCEGNDCGMVGVIPFMKAALFQLGTAVSPAAAAKGALGTESMPHLLTDKEVLSPAELRYLKANIRGFNRSILELLYKDDWDARLAQWRKEGRIRVFDLNYLLALLAQPGGVDPGAEPPHSYTIVDVANDGGIADTGALAIINADKRAARAFYDEVGRPSRLEATARGGVLGPDYVHPTPSGHRLIAMGELYLLKSAAACTLTATLGGFQQQTLEEKFKQSADTLKSDILKDVWVPQKVKDKLGP